MRDHQRLIQERARGTLRDAKQKEATMTARLNLEGWVLQHIWRESHGDAVSEFYQRTLTKLPESHERDRLFNCLVVTVNQRTGETTVRTEKAGYNLAAWARRSIGIEPDKWSFDGSRHVSPCATADWEDWVYDGKHVVRLSAVAGHGEQGYVTY